jgi:polysaccharide export outer membrane protein
MVKCDVYIQIIQPVVGLSLLAFTVIACPSPTQAQLPAVGGSAPKMPEANLARPQGSYKLGGGDLLQIEFLEVPELSREVPVLADGAINLPLIGSVSVRGMTLAEAASAIAAAYVGVLKKPPTVTVNIFTPRPFRFGIAGEVTRPGFYTIPLTAGVGVKPAVLYPTVTQAIEKAGGITQAGDLRRVQVRRPQTGGPEQIINVNLWAILQAGDFSQDILLQDGDGIFVPTATSVNLAEARQTAETSFAPSPEQPRNITVVGEVNRPGSYVVSGGNTTVDIRNLGLPTVTRVLQLAGGITQLADLRRIELRRPTSAGAPQIINVNLWQLLKEGDATQDTVVQEGDTIIVPTATEVNPAEAIQVATANFYPPTIKIYVVGEVRVGGSGAFLQLPPSTTLNQALLTGGFGYENPRARRDSVQLIRLKPDGTVSERTVKIDLTKGSDEETNPLLQNNDIIVVDRNDSTRLSDKLGQLVSPVVQVFPLFNFLGVLRSIFGGN